MSAARIELSVLVVMGELNRTYEKFGLLHTGQIHIQFECCNLEKESVSIPAQSLCIHPSQASQHIASRSQVTSSLQAMQGNWLDGREVFRWFVFGKELGV